MKRITLVPIAGLCNRMNAILSGILYKQSHNDVDLSIYWWKSHDCYCSFDDLFLPLKQFDVKPLKFSFKCRPGVLRNLYFPDFFRWLFYDAYYHNCAFKNYNFDEEIKNKHNIYITAFNSFCQYSYEDVNSIGTISVLQPELQQRLEKVTDSWNDDIIGLHIRRTDNMRSTLNSPTENYFHAVDNELCKNPRARFYIASDSELVKNEFINRYGRDIILTQDLRLDRGSVQGMKDAVVELYTLASCSKIYGTAYSTYSLLASKIYNKEFIDCNNYENSQRNNIVSEK